ncbi:expressed unknown protein [Seminavis robusta]|uniref:Uncharacterized protein n=1 Tax=Seminavis robusta TaxID=568900 RepID=A0A9N8D6I5_9STRA|nr:expressed unknown protein [Seminavis robusta]|eukprot:Sro18_g012790.1 n/a (153) ;mRNA; r:65657-66443
MDPAVAIANDAFIGQVAVPLISEYISKMSKLEQAASSTTTVKPSTSQNCASVLRPSKKSVSINVDDEPIIKHSVEESTAKRRDDDGSNDAASLLKSGDRLRGDCCRETEATVCFRDESRHLPRILTTSASDVHSPAATVGNEMATKWDDRMA